MKTLLDIIDEAFKEMGLGTGLTAAITSLDHNVQQMVALLQALGDELVLEEPYDVDLSDERWVVHADGTINGKITTDTDKFLIDEQLLKKTMMYMYKYNKGLEYGEDQRQALKRHNILSTMRQTMKVHY